MQGRLFCKFYETVENINILILRKNYIKSEHILHHLKTLRMRVIYVRRQMLLMLLTSGQKQFPLIEAEADGAKNKSTTRDESRNS